MNDTGRTIVETLDSGDPARISGLFAPDATWYAHITGACRGRDEIVDTIEGIRQSGVSFRVGQAREFGASRLLLRIEMTGPDGSAEQWQVAELDRDGFVSHLQDYSSAERAEHDLRAAPVRDERPASGPASVLVPFVHVTDVERSAAFYRLLGFEVDERHEPDGELQWVSLRSADARLMLERGDGVDPRVQGVLFYLYSPDLTALREHLVAAGARPGEIFDGSPGPRAELRVFDPDGYCLMVAQIEDTTSAG